MLRWLRRFACVVLALYVLIAATAWVTGATEAYAKTTPRTRWAIGIDRWETILNFQRYSWNQTPGFDSLSDPDFIGTGEDNERDARFSLPGLRIFSGHSETNFTVSVFDPSVDETSIIIDHGLLVCVSLITLLLLLRPEFYQHRRRGCCTKCGYDLRGSTDRCPECGLAIA